MTKLERLENLTLAIWVGSMMGVGYIAAPVLFSMLDDRQMAGMLAGKMFYIVMVVGLVSGSLLLSLRLRDVGMKVLAQWRGWLLLIMFACIAVSMFVLQPMIADVKALGLVEGSDAAKKFGMLHGISSLVYMVAIISGIILLFMGLKADSAKAKS